MDSYREYPSDFDPPASSEAVPHYDVAAEIGSDERRMHVRAYNYWISLLEGRDFPSIEDLEPGEVADFAGHSVLLDFTCGRENPAIPYIGTDIRDECGLSDDARTIADVPSRSLLSRLTDHYMQIIANRAPIGFEAEFANQRNENICYRGILMPFSSDGDSIDFIYGVINWKTAERGAAAYAELPDMPFVTEDEEADVLLLDQEAAIEPLGEPAVIEPVSNDEPEAEEDPGPKDEQAAVPAADGHDAFSEEHLTWADGPSADSDAEIGEPAAEGVRTPIHFAWDNGPLADAEPDEIAELVVSENAGLADRLWAARETAESVKAGEGRTRVSLYRALSLAYDFAIAAQQSPEEYAELLEESGVKAQARAPMTPIVKLVFGVDYDKARLTEFAAALSYAQRQEITLGGFKDFIEKQSGGLKALVAAEREARRPEPKTDTKGEMARAKLRSAGSISLADVPAEEEFAVVVTRRGANGVHEPVAIVQDEALIERAIRRSI
jgi:hypothetical protein